MGDTQIQYGAFGIQTFQREISAELGEAFWYDLTRDLSLPDIATENQNRCQNMAAFMERLENMADAATVKIILYRVRHGLQPSQSHWAREAFLAEGDLDRFLCKHRRTETDHMVLLNKEHKDFYGQDISDAALEFILQHPAMLSPVREGDRLHITAFPSNINEYLKATDVRMKRYWACHCPFAKASILAEKTVSSTLCNCSLGHVSNFVEAFLERSLEGRVLSSVLHGELLCEYEIFIPPDIMAEYVHDNPAS